MPPIEGKLNPPRHPNMDSNLNRIVREAEAGGFTAQAMTTAASGAPISSEQSVAVTLYITEGYADAISAYLSDNGASPRNIGADYIEAYIPVSLLAEASEQEGVLNIRTIIPPQPAQGAVVSEGAAAHGAPAWNTAGIRGQGVKIGVIDLGFEGFRALMGTELPAAGNVQALCYTDVGVVATDTNACIDSSGGKHGTAVTESLFDIAPEAEYYISNPLSFGDLKNAAQWMIDNEVDVINQSLVWWWDGPGDGTSPYSNSPLRAVDDAVAGGATWVNSAGNGAQNSWFGAFEDTDGDGWHNYHNTTDECNTIELKAGERVTLLLRWDDNWLGASRDLDLFIAPLDARGNLALSNAIVSEFVQSGRFGDVPFEIINTFAANDLTGCVAVKRFKGAAPSWIHLASFRNQALEFHTLGGGIANPSESANPGLLAVGASPWSNNSSIEPFSDQGPTPDGRIKPDIVGADRGQTVSYRSAQNPNGLFPGTSQASPHVAGLAALVKQRFPGYTPRQIAQYLKDNAHARGAVPNNTWGYGFAHLPASDAPAATPTDKDKEVLVALYNATNGASWTDSTNWLNDGVPLNSWHGVVTDADGHVTSLSLHDNNLTGSLPPELGNLVNLRVMGLSSNQLSGAIPAEFGSLANLTHMRLGYNQLTGAIPAELGNLTNLESLHLDNNRLSGTIPSELGNLSNIRTIYLQGNQLTGALPSQLTQLTSLEVFAFGNGDAGLCAPTDSAFQNWLQGISNQDIAAGVTPLGPDCTDSTEVPMPGGITEYACNANDLANIGTFTLDSERGPETYAAGYYGITGFYRATWDDSQTGLRAVCFATQYDSVQNARWHGLSYSSVTQRMGATAGVNLIAHRQAFPSPTIGDEMLALHAEYQIDGNPSRLSEVRFIDATTNTVSSVRFIVREADDYPDIEDVAGVARNIEARALPDDSQNQAAQGGFLMSESHAPPR